MKNNFEKFLQNPENRDLIESLPEESRKLLMRADHEIKRIKNIKPLIKDKNGSDS